MIIINITLQPDFYTLTSDVKTSIRKFFPKPPPKRQPPPKSLPSLPIRNFLFQNISHPSSPLNTVIMSLALSLSLPRPVFAPPCHQKKTNRPRLASRRDVGSTWPGTSARQMARVSGYLYVYVCVRVFVPGSMPPSGAGGCDVRARDVTRDIAYDGGGRADDPCSGYICIYTYVYYWEIFRGALVVVLLSLLLAKRERGRTEFRR